MTTNDPAWTLQAVSEHLQRLPDNHGAETASEARYGAVDERVGTRFDVTPGCELQVRDPVMFTVTLKQGGVEKARITAKAQPGAQRV